jgi:23S rRNA (guanosine2251-2'-O)-methyltransferase
MSANKQFICGIHAVAALLSEQPERVLRLCIAKGRMDKKMDGILSAAKQANIAIEYADTKTLDRLASDMNHQGVIAFCTKPRTYDEHDLKALLETLEQPAFLLVLDGVQDPHNLGACFRSADAAGVHAIIAPKDKSASITPIVSKVASGAAEVVPFIQVTNLARTLTMLKEMGIWIYGAAGEATQSLYQAKLQGPIAIVMGAEGEGLRRLTRETCDFLLKIPMRGSVSSLNVSVAAGVFLFEAVRQRTA